MAKVDASAVPRAKTLGQTDGLLKAIVDTETGRILGCSLLCHEAGEVISTVQMVMQAQMPYTILQIKKLFTKIIHSLKRSHRFNNLDSKGLVLE